MSWRIPAADMAAQAGGLVAAMTADQGTREAIGRCAVAASSLCDVLGWDVKDLLATPPIRCHDALAGAVELCATANLNFPSPSPKATQRYFQQLYSVADAVFAPVHECMEEVRRQTS